MPVAQGGRPPARQALVLGAAAALGLLALAFVVTRFDRLDDSGRAPVEVGEPVFTLGQASEIAATIADTGPLLLPDAARGDRDVYVQHLGDDPAEGWTAFSARPPGADRACFVEWRADDRVFVDRCDQSTFPASGDGLERYAVSVDAAGALTINLAVVELPEP